MSWTFVASGTASNGSNSAGPLTPGLPSGWGVGDLLFCQFQCFGGTNSRVPSMPSTWLPVSGTGTWLNGTSSHGLWYKQAMAGETAPSVTLTGSGVASDTQLSRIHGFRSNAGSTVVATIRQAGSQHTNASADNIGVITGLSGTTAGDLMILSAGKSNDWNGAAALTGWTTAADTESTTGNDAGMTLLYILSGAGGDYASLTVSDNGGTASAGVGLAQMVEFYEVIPTMPTPLQAVVKPRRARMTLTAL